MVQITYPAMIFAISLIWVLVRLICALMHRKLNWKRELQLVLVYICLIVVARFTFFPFS